MHVCSGISNIVLSLAYSQESAHGIAALEPNLSPLPPATGAALLKRHVLYPAGMGRAGSRDLNSLSFL